METIISKTRKIDCLFKSCSVSDAQPQACGSSDLKFSDVSTTSVNSASESSSASESDHREILDVGNPDQIEKCRSVHVMPNCGLVPETEASLILTKSRHSSDSDNNCDSSEGEDTVHTVLPERSVVEAVSYTHLI